MVYPLVKLGILPKDYPVSVHAVSGYSGAGKKAIAVYESDDRPAGFDSPRQYALTQQHKHLPEMQKICGLDYAPAFNPLVCDYFSGWSFLCRCTQGCLQRSTPRRISARRSMSTTQAQTSSR